MLAACLVYQFFFTKKYPLTNLNIIHCNHKIRKQSEQESKFIQDFFKWLPVQIFTRPASIKITEDWLRKRRYQVFAKAMKSSKSEILILGHHLDDRIESTFLNILRGAHLRWFLSIQAFGQHHLLDGKTVLRPLISIQKKDIFALCQKYTVPFFHDETNDDSETSQRNLVRNIYIPQLKELMKTWFYTTIQNLYKKFQHAGESFLDWLITLTPSPYRWAKNYLRRDIQRSKINLSQVAWLLEKLGIYNDIGSSTLKELQNFFTKNDGYKYIKGRYFFIAHTQIYLIQAPKQFRKKHVDKRKKITKIQNINLEGKQIPLKPEDKIADVVRYPKPSDIAKNKTRNKYCIGQKIPIFWRNFVPVLAKDNKVFKAYKHFISQ